jgi:uncharacterized damage-inducible protein DinB
MIPYLQKLAQYDAWANQQVCASVASVPKDAPPVARDKVATLLAHLAAAKRVWLNRIAGKAAGIEVWPKLELDAATELLTQADREFVELTLKLDLAELTRPVIYRTSRGQSHATPLVDVVTQVINHSTYHRGQLASAIAAAGGTAAASDYIVWARR